jgi:4-amino-4-deoxy-L-arabinose transferase-like glycosyltransferase
VPATRRSHARPAGHRDGEGARARRTDAAALWLLTLGVALLVLHRLGATSFVQDEGFSATLVTSTGETFWDVITTREANASGFFLLQRLLDLPVSEGWFRLPAALAGILCVPAVWCLARRVADRSTAFLACVVLIGMQLFVGASRLARGFALEMLLVVLATLFLAIAVQDGRPGFRWAWAACLVAAVWMHALALLLVPAHLAALLLAGDARRVARLWIPPSLALGAGVSPLVLFFATRSSDQIFWIEATDLEVLHRLARELLGGDRARMLLYGAAIAVALVGVASRRRRPHRNEWALWLVLLAGLAPVVLAVGLSFVKPILFPTYFAFCLPFVAILVAAGARALPHRAAFLFTVILVLVALRGAHRTWTPIPTEDWRGATRYLVAHARSEDAFAVKLPDERAVVEHYALRLTGIGSLPRPCFPADPWGQLVPASGRRPASVTRDVLACAAGRPRLWLEYLRFDDAFQADMELAGWRRVSKVTMTNVVVEELVPE